MTHTYTVGKLTFGAMLVLHYIRSILVRYHYISRCTYTTFNMGHRLTKVEICEVTNIAKNAFTMYSITT